MGAAWGGTVWLERCGWARQPGAGLPVEQQNAKVMGRNNGKMSEAPRWRETVLAGDSERA